MSALDIDRWLEHISGRPVRIYDTTREWQFGIYRGFRAERRYPTTAPKQWIWIQYDTLEELRAGVARLIEREERAPQP